MVFRFNKRIKHFQGLHLNISKRGYSIRVGKKGLTTNIARKGLGETVSALGTGLSYQTKTVKLGQGPRTAKAPPRQSTFPNWGMSVMASIMVLAAILWVLAHWH